MPKGGNDPSADTVVRMTVWKGELIKDQEAVNWGECRGKALGFDKTTMYYERNLFELHLHGIDKDNNDFCRLWCYVDLDSSVKPIDVVLEVMR